MKMIVGIEDIERGRQRGQGQGDLAIQEAPEASVRSPDAQAVPPIVTSVRVTSGARLTGRLADNAERQDADRQDNESYPKAHGVAMREAAVRAGQQPIQQSAHPQPQHARDPASIAEQTPAPGGRDTLADHDPVGGLVQPHRARMDRDDEKQSPDEPAGVSPSPHQRQRDQRQQGEPFQQGDPEQVAARPRQPTNVPDHQQAGQKDQQVVECGQAPDGRVAGPQMVEEKRQEGCLREQGRPQRPADGVGEAGGEIEALVGLGQDFVGIVSVSHGYFR